MRNRQSGITFIGWLILLTPFAIVIYAGIRVAPLYLNYMKVVRALDGTAAEMRAGGASPSTIRTAIDKHFEIDMVDYPTTKDLKITRDGGSWVVESAYSAQAPLLDNVSINIDFDKTVKISGSSE